MKALIFQTVVTRTGTGRRKKIATTAIYAVPESVTDNSGASKSLITDSLNNGVITAAFYSTRENANRESDPVNWRRYQTAFNRARRSVGVHGAVFTELGRYETPSKVTTLPTGNVSSFTDIGYLGNIENDTDTQNEWDDGEIEWDDAPSANLNNQPGILFRLARNNAVFFIPEGHLASFVVTGMTEKAAKALFGHNVGNLSPNQRIAPSPRLTGIKNIFYGKDPMTISPAYGDQAEAAWNPGGIITSFSQGQVLDLLEKMRDFDDDVVSDAD